MPQDDIFCIWEASQPLSAEEFQSFIDGPDGPAPGVFINRVFPVIEGGITPSTAFPASGLNAIMAKIEACPTHPTATPRRSGRHSVRRLSHVSCMVWYRSCFRSNWTRWSPTSKAKGAFKKEA